MTQTIQQALEANKLELDRLIAIYTEISEYAKQKHGMSLFQLENAIEQADQLDNMLNNQNLQEDLKNVSQEDSKNECDLSACVKVLTSVL